MEIVEKKMRDIASLLRAPLADGKAVAFTIRGVSMWPLFYSGRDKVVLQKAHHYRKYDIVLYERSNGSFAVHRIVGKKHGAFVLAGDGEFEKEYPIFESQIWAKAVSGERKGKAFSCNSFRFRLYSVLWVLILPLRPYAVRAAVAVKRRLKKKKCKRWGKQ